MKYIFILIAMTYSLFGFGSFLQPEDAFKPSASIDGDKLTVKVELAESIYLYKDKLNISLKDGGAVLGDINYPKAAEHGGEKVYMESVEVTAPLTKSSQSLKDVVVVVDFQGCSEKGLCYEPITKEFTLGVDPLKLEFAKGDVKSESMVKPESTVSGSQSETDTIAETFKSGNVSLILLTFFGFGLLLALTPCVFPMIPILSSIIVSQGEGMSAKKGFALSLVYVLSMSVAYTMAGVLAGVFGSNIQASMQNPYVISVFAAIFVTLAISMFGFFEIGLPSSIQSRISNHSDKAGSRGGFIGVAIMGFLSALIVGPCVAPPLAGALVYIGQTGDAVLGGMALFVMSLGMGAPLLLIGIGAGKFMPRPGGWMTSVSKVFGVVMLAIAIWMLSRVLPGSVIMFLWALLFVVSSVYLGAFEALKDEKKGWNALSKGLGLASFIIGLSLFVGVLSAATNPLDPFEKFTSKGTVSKEHSGKKNDFKKIHSIAELDDVLKNSKGKKVMLDFYADWCTSCKELEHNTFSDPDVKKALGSFVLIQADVTKNSADEKALTKKFGLFGPPAMIFFDEESRMIDSKTLVGYKNADKFLEHIKNM